MLHEMLRVGKKGYFLFFGHLAREVDTLATGHEKTVRKDVSHGCVVVTAIEKFHLAKGDWSAFALLPAHGNLEAEPSECFQPKTVKSITAESTVVERNDTIIRQGKDKRQSGRIDEVRAQVSAHSSFESRDTGRVGDEDFDAFDSGILVAEGLAGLQKELSRVSAGDLLFSLGHSPERLDELGGSRARCVFHEDHAWQ
ncbi:hypothetical protein HG531_009974 [Fusarium graminearum]|nr:hypothetical protein HG531_009974 [Fusarium graminearum]